MTVSREELKTRVAAEFVRQMREQGHDDDELEADGQALAEILAKRPPRELLEVEP